MIERDIWLAANQMMKLFGDEAELHAVIHAAALYDRGDEEGCAAWKRVRRVIDELKSTEQRGMAN
jgi:hypothetical protein